MNVEIVRARLADFVDLSRFRSALSADERARAAAYKIEEARDVFILARGLLRLELSKRLGLDPSEIRFDIRPSGKPDVRADPPSRPDWRFSVSHSGSHVAIAFARGVDIGVDIERLGRRLNPLEIAKRYFTPTELEALQGCAEEARVRAFFAGWTRKEAIVKARGHTMAQSLTTLSVDLNPEATHPGYQDAPSVPERPVCRLIAFEFKAESLIGAVAIQASATPRLRIDVLSATAFD